MEILWPWAAIKGSNKKHSSKQRQTDVKAQKGTRKLGVIVRAELRMPQGQVAVHGGFI